MSEKLPDVPKYKLKLPVDTVLETEETTRQFSAVPILLGVVALLVAILAGRYFWFVFEPNTPAEIENSSQRPTAEENDEPESTTAEARTDTLEAMSESINLDVIESDLSGTFIDPLDLQIGAIEAALGL